NSTNRPRPSRAGPPRQASACSPSLTAGTRCRAGLARELAAIPRRCATRSSRFSLTDYVHVHHYMTVLLCQVLGAAPLARPGGTAITIHVELLEAACYVGGPDGGLRTPAGVVERAVRQCLPAGRIIFAHWWLPVHLERVPDQRIVDRLDPR